jgi:hypothetical protein
VSEVPGRASGLVDAAVSRLVDVLLFFTNKQLTRFWGTDGKIKAATDYRLIQDQLNTSF